MPEREKINAEIAGLENMLQSLEFEQFEQTAQNESNPAVKKYAKFAGFAELIREMVDCLVSKIIVCNGGRTEVILKCYDEFNIINNL